MKNIQLIDMELKSLSSMYRQAKEEDKPTIQGLINELWKQFNAELETREIEWEIEEEIDVLDFNWAVYSISGIDQDGIEYWADTQSDRIDPKIEEIENIELK
jgi:hypothetical protein